MPGPTTGNTIPRAFLRFMLTALTAAALAACTPGIKLDPVLPPDPDTVPDGRVHLKAVTYQEIPNWRSDDIRAALDVFLTSCQRIVRRSPDAPFGNDPRTGRVSDWIRICDDAMGQRTSSRDVIHYFFESRFQPYQVRVSGEPEGLFTGYFEAELDGSWEPGGRFSIPIYARPDDLIAADLGEFRDEWEGTSIAGRLVDGRYVPYFSRAEINRGALSGRGLEMLWVDDPIDAFFLHIQGSGRIRLQDGASVRVGYAGRNGHRYVPIGRELIGMGVLTSETVSMQSIRAWLDAHPLAAADMMNRNPSFIFFRVLEENSPVGAQGLPLTPERSLAVDTRYVPLGTPVWLSTRDPRDPKRKTPYQRLMIAQDTGSAIKGGVRGDVYWGSGEAAAAAAGVMKEPGVYYILLPRSAANALPAGG
ncbi:MAG: murein transglycosylase A [Rhodospirillales bacterium]